MRFSRIDVASRDPSAALAWYARLGLGIDGDAVVAGATRVRFVEGRPEGAVHLAFNVPAHRFEDAKAWLRARVPLRVEDGADEFDFPSWDARACYFLDVDGNVLEFIARRRLASRFEGPFAAAAVERVSEVGVPVPDVPAGVARLCDALGERPWGPTGDAFGTVGDEEGLLIVVREGRPWFSTDAAARAAPLSVRLEDGREVPLR